MCRAMWSGVCYINHQVNILPSLDNLLLSSHLPPVYSKVGDAMMKIMGQGLTEITQRNKNEDFLENFTDLGIIVIEIHFSKAYVV